MSDPQPFYSIHVFICTNRRPDGHPRGSCAASGSEAIRDHLKQRVHELGLRGVRINTAGCLGRCHLGPAMVIYPEGVWYACQTIDDADEILETHVKNGGRVERLMLMPDQKARRPEPTA